MDRTTHAGHARIAVTMMATMIAAVSATAARSAPIGTATREPDGTIVLDPRADGPRGAVGDTRFRVLPSDKDYPMVAKHVGPIPKGGSVPVQPFER